MPQTQLIALSSLPDSITSYLAAHRARDTAAELAVVELLLSLSRKREDTGRTSRHFSSNITN